MRRSEKKGHGFICQSEHFRCVICVRIETRFRWRYISDAISFYNFIIRVWPFILLLYKQNVGISNQDIILYGTGTIWYSYMVNLYLNSITSRSWWYVGKGEWKYENIIFETVVHEWEIKVEKWKEIVDWCIVLIQFRVHFSLSCNYNTVSVTRVAINEQTYKRNFCFNLYENECSLLFQLRKI